MGERAALLESLRVIDLSCGDGDAVARILADLGADVLKVEPPGGSPARAVRPRLAGTGIAFALHNANKRGIVLDPGVESDRTRLLELIAGADVLIDSGRPGFAAAFGASAAELTDRFEHLVALSVTDFGMSGPRAHWRATDAVLYALSSALSRSAFFERFTQTVGLAPMEYNDMLDVDLDEALFWGACVTQDKFVIGKHE